MYGGEPEVHVAQENVRTVPNYVFNFKKSLVEAYAAIQETLGTKLQMQIDIYNSNVHARQGILSCYSVRLYKKGTAHRFCCPWIGPYTVLSQKPHTVSNQP